MHHFLFGEELALSLNSLLAIIILFFIYVIIILCGQFLLPTEDQAKCEASWNCYHLFVCGWNCFLRNGLLIKQYFSFMYPSYVWSFCFIYLICHYHFLSTIDLLMSNCPSTREYCFFSLKQNSVGSWHFTLHPYQIYVHFQDHDRFSSCLFHGMCLYSRYCTQSKSLLYFLVINCYLNIFWFYLTNFTKRSECLQ